MSNHNYDPTSSSPYVVAQTLKINPFLLGKVIYLLNRAKTLPIRALKIFLFRYELSVFEDSDQKNKRTIRARTGCGRNIAKDKTSNQAIRSKKDHFMDKSIITTNEVEDNNLAKRLANALAATLPEGSTQTGRDAIFEAIEEKERVEKLSKKNPNPIPVKHRIMLFGCFFVVEVSTSKKMVMKFLPVPNTGITDLSQTPFANYNHEIDLNGHLYEIKAVRKNKLELVAIGPAERYKENEAFQNALKARDQKVDAKVSNVANSISKALNE